MSRSVALQGMSTTADAYDSWFEGRWGRYAFAIEAARLRDTVGRVDEGLVLDAGCGTGRFGVELDVVGGRLVGLDVARSMLALAARRLPGALVAGDIGLLPFCDGVFDVAAAVTVLEFVADPDRALAELLRVTRPGGRVVVGALNRRSPWGAVHRRHGEAWAGARLLTAGQLAALGARHGDDVVVSGALYAPGPIPGLGVLGPALEWFGRRVLPRSGAFQVLVVRRR